MAGTYDLIVRGGTIVNHAGTFKGDVGVSNGKIAYIGDLSTADAGEVFDARGLHVLPGVIDTQVHFREPGMEHKENLEAGARGAVLGGVTAVFEMPNTNPTTTDEGALADKLKRAKGRMDCDHAFYIGGTPENTDHLGELERLPGACGVKVFMGASTGNLLIETDEGVEAVLRNVNRRATFHSEDEFRLEDRRSLARDGDWTSHTDVRDAEAARLSTERLIRLARKCGKRIHVLHVSTLDEVPLLAAAKDIATAEITPQHLTLEGPDAYERLKGRAQMNPPVRGADHRAALWEAVRQGVADVIGSDHAPHTLEEKSKPYPASPSGMPGVQTLLPIMLHHVNAGRVSLERVVDMTSGGAQRVFGTAGKGRMAQGYDGDLTIVDMKESREITDAQMANVSGWTPFAGMTVTGWPRATVIRGNIVMRDDELTAPGLGEPVRFMETLQPNG